MPWFVNFRGTTWKESGDGDTRVAEASNRQGHKVWGYGRSDSEALADLYNTAEDVNVSTELSDDDARVALDDEGNPYIVGR